ncbi:MAG: PKD domain-containing protein [Acidimicrobiales bacterium]
MADDPFFGPAFIDVDEWREQPVRHRYMHGGFEGTDTRFSYYLPPPEVYRRRFLHVLEGGSGGHETTATSPFGSMGGISFAFECGAYLVESNQGHFGGDLSILRTEPTVHAYRASAQSARYGRVVAEAMYGDAPRHGYIYGGSGGSARCILCIEKCPDVWSGAVPFIIGHSTSWSLGFSVQANAARLLGDHMGRVVDATDPGGSGDPFADLTSEQREALAAMYKAGFPRGGEWAFSTSGYVGTFSSHVSALSEFDPEYFEDFWSKPGYAGADGLLATALVEEKSTVRRVVTAGELLAMPVEGDQPGRMFALWSAGSEPDLPIGIEVEGLDATRALGAGLRLTSGAGAGRELYCVATFGNVLVGAADVSYRFEDVQPGDEIMVDNRRYLAFCYFHRHQVEPGPEYGHFTVDGRPVYPQRPRLFSKSGMLAGDSSSANLEGKMIVVQNAHDAATWPNAALSFQAALRDRFDDGLPDRFRLWFNDHAMHIPSSILPARDPPVPATRVIDYGGCLEQALQDLMAWVEEGIAPPASTGYEVNADQCITLRPDADARRGIQPVLDAAANGAARADAKVGEPVRFTARAEVPPGAGTVIAAEWDFDGTGKWAHRHEVDGTAATVQFDVVHIYDAPGTYYATARVVAHRDGRVDAAHRRVANLGRTRVVVHG